LGPHLRKPFALIARETVTDFPDRALVNPVSLPHPSIDAPRAK